MRFRELEDFMMGIWFFEPDKAFSNWNDIKLDHGYTAVHFNRHIASYSSWNTLDSSAARLGELYLSIIKVGKKKQATKQLCHEKEACETENNWHESKLCRSHVSAF